MMDAPPRYEELTAGCSGYDSYTEDKKLCGSRLQRWNLREQVIASRTQHLALVVSPILSVLEKRARAGIANTTMILVPAGQDQLREFV